MQTSAPILSSNSLACFCSGSGHSFRPWRSRASKTQPLGVFIVASFGSPGWVDHQWYLVGRDYLSNHHFSWYLPWQESLILHKQIGTLEEPGCSSPYVAMGTTAAGNWGPSAGSVRTCTFMQCPLTPAFPFMVIGLKRGNCDLLCGVNSTFNTIQLILLHISTGSLSPDKFCCC